MGASKYDKQVAPYLDAIRSWRAQGTPLHTIAENLRISRRSLIAYRGKHPELDRALEISVDIANARVGGAVFQAACGHRVQLTETTVNDLGEKTTRTREVYYPPDMKAAAMWLYNHDSGWRPEREIAEAMAAKRERGERQGESGGVIQIPAVNLEGYEQERQRELERLKAEEEADG